MITLTTHRGETLYIAAAAIASVKETGASSQWHGIRSIVKEFDGTIHECQETATEILFQIEEELR